MRKLGADRPDLLVRLLDDPVATKQATHLFHQLGSSIGRGSGRVVGDVLAGAGAPFKQLGLPQVAHGLSRTGEIASNVLRGTGTVAGGLTDAAVTPFHSLVQFFRRSRGK